MQFESEKSESEQKIAYLTEREEKLNSSYKLLLNENQLLKSEVKNNSLKIEFLNRRTEDMSSLESVFSELKTDYDEIVKEKSMLAQNYETQVFYLKQESKELKN